MHVQFTRGEVKMAKHKHGTPFKLANVTLFWAFTAEPNNKSQKYQVDLCKLSERYVSALEEMGVSVHNKGDDRGFYVTAKSKHPIHTTDPNGELITRNLIGNGSVGDAVCVTYPFTVGEGTGIGLNKLKVTA